MSSLQKPYGRRIWPLALWGAIFAAALQKIANFDYWTHLHLGRTFSTTWSLWEALRNGLNETVNGWPFQLALFKLFLAGGHELVAIVVAAVFATIFPPFLFQPGEDRRTLFLIRILFLLLAVNICFYRLMPRPELIAYLLFSFALLLVRSWLLRPRGWKLVTGGVLLFLWLPLHPTVFMGMPFLLGALALLSGKDHLAIFWGIPRRYRYVLLLAIFGVVLAFSQGFFFFVAREMTSDGILQGVSEMRPAWEFPEVLFKYLPLATLVLGICLAAKPIRIRLLLLYVPVVVVGLIVVRNIALSALALVFLGTWGANYLSAPATPVRPYWSRLMTILLVVANLSVVCWVFSESRPRWGVGLAQGVFPVEAARFVKDTHLPGPVFNNFDCGGYLLWIWQEEPKHFMDGRLSTRDRLQDYNLILEGQTIQPLLDKYQISTVLVQPCYWNSGRIFPLLNLLMLMPDWKLLHASDALVFSRAPSPALTETPKNEGWLAILRIIDHYEWLQPEARHLDFSRGIALQGLGRHAEAQQAFAKGAARYPELAGAYQRLIQHRRQHTN